MKKGHLATLRWRRLRWFALAAAAPALWACTARRLAPPNPDPRGIEQRQVAQSVNRKIDLLFVIDDSPSMKPLQGKMIQRMPDFMDVLKGLPGGLPDLHVAVLTSSMGAGAYERCVGAKGNKGGQFQVDPHPPAGVTCPMIMGTNRFIEASQTANNIGGLDNLANAFSCIANVGDEGCGFEMHLEAIYQALGPSVAPNAGFLRPDAYLGIVMLANEDDCSAEPGLFDPNQTLNSDTLGGLQSYRCARFGHTCSGGPPPGDPAAIPASGLTLEECASNEMSQTAYPGHGLYPVKDYIDFVKALKPENKILVAVIGGPKSPYKVVLEDFQTGAGTVEKQPKLDHSCTAPGAAGTTEYADPSPRLFQFLEAFGRNGVFQPICAEDFRMSMVRIAEEIGRILGPQCVEGNVLNRTDAPDVPDCRITEIRYTDDPKNPDTHEVPHCDDTRANGTQPLGDASATSPCWRFVNNMAACGAGNELQVCYDPTCNPSMKPMNTEVSAAVTCAIGL